MAVGDEVTRVKIGDVVGNAWLWTACGECEFCESGWETLCLSQKNGGYAVNGSFGEYMLVDARYCPVLPDGVDRAAIAPILCAGVTVYKGLKRTEARPGQWVLISGIGGLGHIAVQYAVAMGLRVVAIDVDDTKLALATKHGAEVVVNAATTEDPAAAVVEATGGGVHGALVTAVNAHAFPQALGALRRGGTMSLVGLAPEKLPARHLLGGAQRLDRARLDRRHAAGHGGGDRLLRPRSDQPDLHGALARGDQRHLRLDAGRRDRRPSRRGHERLTDPSTSFGARGRSAGGCPRTFPATRCPLPPGPLTQHAESTGRGRGPERRSDRRD